MLFDILKANIDELTDDLFIEKQVTVSVLRLDKIHPIVSGNKLFKLHYFLQDAVKDKKPILTFGGAYSNHLLATAFACAELKLKSIGIVRGEQPVTLSPTLRGCMDYGMQLKFISRQDFAAKENSTNDLQTVFGDCCIIPEGGYHPQGAKGAALIMDLIKDKKYSHICTALGTATTLAGLVIAAKPGQAVIGVPVLKGMNDINERLQYLANSKTIPENMQLLDGYHFGGYAKKDATLIQFMNECWRQYNLPLDFVYTAKMMYAVIGNIENGYFKKGSNILCLHTGGLQGNKSLPLNTLLF